MDRGATVEDLLGSLDSLEDEEERRAWAGACAHALGVDGVAVSLGEELVWFSDRTSARLEDVQFVIGQGPSLFLLAESGVLEVPDLDRLLVGQWPQFVPEAKELGVAALFVWPVNIGAAQVGTLTGYRRTAGPLAGRHVAEGWLVADSLAGHLLGRWPGMSAGEEGDGPGSVGAVDLHRAEVHQATGVLSVRLDVPVAEALARLRARAFASGRSLTDTARFILDKEVPP
ncbi:ANTAR domain-containing protein [Streptomyces sp. NPDC050439]|uniref:ANTAR domain-containing protein n=1 Tax=unclassified Streptomyces TaxID=2593676 RepID=UPI0034288F8E